MIQKFKLGASFDISFENNILVKPRKKFLKDIQYITPLPMYLEIPLYCPLRGNNRKANKI